MELVPLEVSSSKFHNYLRLILHTSLQESKKKIKKKCVEDRNNPLLSIHGQFWFEIIGGILSQLLQMPTRGRPSCFPFTIGNPIVSL